MTEFEARTAEYGETIRRKYQAMTAAHYARKTERYYQLKAEVRELRQELRTAHNTGKFADGVSR